MKHLFVPFEIALKLKGLRFKEESLYCYVIADEAVSSSPSWINYNKSKSLCSRPLYQQVVDWLREEHKMHLRVDIQDVKLQWFCYEILVEKEGDYTNELEFDMNFKSYYEALETGITKALDLIKP